MVLEAAFSDDSPTNDTDAYDSSDGTGSQDTTLRIDVSQAKQPFTILGPLFGFGTSELASMSAGIAREAPRIIQRSLTQEELDAVVTSVSQYFQVQSTIFSVALILGFFRARSTRREMIFPMARAFKKIPINIDHFGPLRGRPARTSWYAAHLSLWGLWYGFPGYIFGGIAGHAAMAQTQLTDKRLNRFNQDMQNEASKRRLQNAVNRRDQGLPQKPDGLAMRGRQESDDMSPQGDAELGKDGYLEIQSRVQEARRQASIDTSSADTIETMRDTERTQQPSAQGFNRNRDGSLQATRNQIPQSTNPSESAWDRIRKQVSSSEQPSSPTRWQPGSNSPSNDYTFDEQDEDRQLAKVEAQKEFDARIERERQGKDFNSPRGGGTGRAAW